jgi:hypothetical protein
VQSVENQQMFGRNMSAVFMMISYSAYFSDLNIEAIISA